MAFIAKSASEKPDALLHFRTMHRQAFKLNYTSHFKNNKFSTPNSIARWHVRRVARSNEAMRQPFRLGRPKSRGPQSQVVPNHKFSIVFLNICVHTREKHESRIAHRNTNTSGILLSESTCTLACSEMGRTRRGIAKAIAFQRQLVCPNIPTCKQKSCGKHHHGMGLIASL